MPCKYEATCICELTIQSKFSNKKQKSLSEIFKSIFSLRFLHLLRNDGHNKSFSIQENLNTISTPFNGYHNQRESQAVLLEIDRKKTIGLMEWQRSRLR